MPYDKDTPASINETFSVSQPKITANFNSIKTLVDQDHETFGAANEGKHKQVTMPAQLAASTTTATERAIYCKNNAAAAPALWIQDAGVGAPADGVDITTINGNTISGYSRLPSGLILHWGQFTLNTVAATEGNKFKTIVFDITMQMSTVYNVSYSAYNNTAVNPKDLTFTYALSGGAPFTGIVFTRGIYGAVVTFHYSILGA